MASAPPGRDVGGDAAGHHGVHHQPVAEGRRGGAQHGLAMPGRSAPRAKGEAGGGGDGAAVAEVVGHALELRHDRAQRGGARRRLDAAGRLGGAGEGEPNAPPCCRPPAARRSAPPPAATCRASAPSVPLCAQPRRVSSRSTVSPARKGGSGRLGDAGLHRPERDLVMVLRFDGQEVGGLGRRRARPAAAARAAPSSARCRGRAKAGRRPALGRVAPEVGDHPLEPGGRRAVRRQRGVAAVLDGHRDQQPVRPGGSCSRAWTRAGSAHSASRSGASGSASAAAMARHSSAISMARGHGRQGPWGRRG